MPLTGQALPQGNIMIVDDNPANLMLMEEMLLQEGYEVSSFPLGSLALSAAMDNPPDLILLDINMPEMNGYEVCERLKATEALSEIPVIFLSALNETQDKVKAFRFGAVDYISKPFQFEEVHSRVETHLKMNGLQRALTAQNEHLEEAVAARTRELAGALDRLTILDRAKNDFLKLISHEFRTPLNGLLGAGELIMEGMSSTEENGKIQALFGRSRRKIIEILDDALLLTQIDVNGDQFKSAPVCFGAVLGRAVEGAAKFAESRRVTIAQASAATELVVGDEDLLVRALHALLEAAVKFSNAGETVCVTHEIVGDSLRAVVVSSGRKIPDSAISKFFDVFSIAEAMTPGGDLGLGPAVAHRIFSLFGASVSVANREPSGIQLTISLKRVPNGAKPSAAELPASR
ncbi:MAG: response regulator [Bryobacteraceae bacterium]|jgi:DNA-binding response OmpR family regulator